MDCQRNTIVMNCHKICDKGKLNNANIRSRTPTKESNNPISWQQANERRKGKVMYIPLSRGIFQSPFRINVGNTLIHF